LLLSPKVILKINSSSTGINKQLLMIPVLKKG
jgi:hypothetical protein